MIRYVIKDKDSRKCKHCVSDPSVKVIPGKYGPRHYDCHCEGHCHPGTGACQGACRQGWAGPTCQINTSMSDYIMIAIPDGDYLCLIILGVFFSLLRMTPF